MPAWPQPALMKKLISLPTPVGLYVLGHLMVWASDVAKIPQAYLEAVKARRSSMINGHGSFSIHRPSDVDAFCAALGICRNLVNIGTASPR